MEAGTVVVVSLFRWLPSLGLVVVSLVGFSNDSARNFWRKGAPTMDLEKYCLYLFLNEDIKLERYTSTNTW
jgi:hypothetical protein